MVNRASLLTLAMLLPLSADAGETPQATVGAFHAALARGDAAAARLELAEDVLIFEAGQVERSAREYAEHHLAADIAFARAVTRKVLSTQQLVQDAVAVVMQTSETSGRYNDKPVNSFGTETMVLMRSGGTWRIRHVHWSSRRLP